MKQSSLFEDEFPQEENKYTSKIKSPTYTPKNRFPHTLELADNSKALRLINEILNANITDEEKKFLKFAAMRHVVFNYSKIADYYANATPEMQHLMERSALIIIDFEKAILYGYTNLSNEIANQYLEDHGDEKQ